MDASRARVDALVRGADLDLVGEPVLVTSYSNDAWYVRSASAGEAVLRVCWIGDRERLLREAAVGRVLPAEVGYPSVLASGSLTLDGALDGEPLDGEPLDGEPLTWMLSRRLEGTTLRAAWPELDPGQREHALADVAGPLGALHAWRPPAEVSARLGPPPPSDDPPTIIGRSILPLPIERVRHLVRPAADRAGEHRAVVGESWDWLVEHADLLPRLDDPADVITHGDLHLDNVWWDGRRVTGLLDLEWVRWAPAWTDLVPVRDNALAGDEGSAAHAALLASLVAELPELRVPELDRRLTAVELTFQLRQLLVWPAPTARPAVDHPIRLLERLLHSVR